MAKLKAKRGTTSKEGGPGRDEASEAEAQLRAYHALGRKVLARVKEGRLDAATLQELGAETGYGFDNIRKARVFAKVDTEGQLDGLCRLRTLEEMPLPWRHVRQLLMLPPGKAREALQRKAAKRGWSLGELVAAIPKEVRRRQSRREGGRTFRGPKTMADGLRQVVRHGDQWLRRYRKVWAGDDWLEGRLGAVGPGGMKSRLAEARETLWRVRESVAELEGRLKRVEAAAGDGQRAGPVAPAPGAGGAKPGRRTKVRARRTT